MSDQLAKRPEQALEAIGGKTMDVDRGPELAAIAVAASAKAAIEARIVMALKRPRSYDLARERLMTTAGRPAFAERAIYKKPAGKGTITGLSVRFAEEALRAFGNLEVTTECLYDDDDRVVVKVTAVDLETMAVYSDTAVVQKKVERKGSPSGRDVIATRVNSFGDKVLICKATEDEVATKTAAVKSKLRRNAILALIPVDLADEARAACEATSAREIAGNLPQVRERMISAFAQLKPAVSPSELSKYLGHDVKQASVEEMQELKQILNGLAEGGRWGDFLETRLGDRAPASAPPPPSAAPAAESNPATEPKSGSDDFGSWLIARMRDAKSVDELTKLATRKSECPQGRHAELAAVFSARKKEIGQ
jgi:hypothetical protein